MSATGRADHMPQEYPAIERPLPVPHAFLEDHPAALASQAAFYLGLGSLLDKHWREELLSERKFTEEFPLPRELEPRGDRFTYRAVRAESAERFSFPINPPEVWSKSAYETAGAVFEKRSAPAAALAIEVGVSSPHPLVRVAAIISAADHFQPARSFRGLLGRELAQTDDPLVAEMAATALARFERPHHTQPAERWPGQGARTAAQKSLILVNGTIPPGTSIHTGMPETWWRPGGDLHDYLRDGSRPDIYSRPDFYEWEGGYSLFAHEVAAKNLVCWQAAHPSLVLDVVTHSHGGNMAMLATWFGLRVDRLVLLSCPVHWAFRQPCPANVGTVQSVRVKFDLVIIADRGGQRFPAGTISEHVLPFWFVSHSTTHKSATWRSQGLDRYL